MQRKGEERMNQISVNPLSRFRERGKMETDADPLPRTLVRLLAFDLLAVQQNPRLPGKFFRKGRPVKTVEIMGVVVTLEKRESYVHFKLDDGTGCVPCILWTNHLSSAYFAHLKEAERQLQAGITEVHADQVKLGRLLRVQGRISCFRSQLQITIFSLGREEDPNAEVLHWMHCMQLAFECYDNGPLPPSSAAAAN